jgi:DNA-binding transcriptional regulator YiaG
MKKNFNGFMGLKYIELRNVPVVKGENGDAIAAEVLGKLEQQVAEALLEHSVPIRGLEVRFLRESCGLSLREFGKLLDLSDVAILKWERKPTARLSFINEIAVRALIATRLHLPFVAAELFEEESVSKIVIDYARPKNGEWLFAHLRGEYPGLAG